MGVVERCRRILAKALSDLPGSVIQASSDARRRIRLEVRVAERAYRVVALWAGQGWPAGVSTAIANVPDPWPVDHVVMADHFSRGSLELLATRRANWVDDAGHARLLVPPGLAVVKGVPTQPSPGRQPPFAWSASAISIVESILHAPENPLRTKELAERTGWSPAQVSKVLRGLDAEGWTLRQGPARGPKVRRDIGDRARLLDAWASAVSDRPRRKRFGHAIARDLLRFAHMRLPKAMPKRENEVWALTTWAGLELIAPFVTMVPVLHVYLAADVWESSSTEEAFQSAGIRQVEEGSRIEFWEADVPLLTQPGHPARLPVCSTPRLYADLLALGGRGVDAALHLREVALGF